MDDKITGGCLCGNVRFEVTEAPSLAARCYCRDCQRAGGSESAQAIGISPDAFKLTKGSLKSYEVTADSGNTVRRCFCENCGSPVAAYPLGFPKIMSVKICSLDNPAAYKPQFGIYTDSAQPWTEIPDSLPQFKQSPKSPEQIQQVLTE